MGASSREPESECVEGDGRAQTVTAVPHRVELRQPPHLPQHALGPTRSSFTKLAPRKATGNGEELLMPPQQGRRRCRIRCRWEPDEAARNPSREQLLSCRSAGSSENQTGSPHTWTQIAKKNFNFERMEEIGNKTCILTL